MFPILLLPAYVCALPFSPPFHKFAEFTVLNESLTLVGLKHHGNGKDVQFAS